MFRAALVNEPFDDPVVYGEGKYVHEAFLFDLGNLHALPARNILKIGHVFVSHAHVDHFIGFDHMLRICLGRDQTIRLFGPAGFLARVEGKLSGYTWNLVENYLNDFVLYASEITPEKIVTKRYRCRNAFRTEEISSLPYNGMIAESRLFSVRATFLDHHIPCLAFRLETHERVNIMKNVLDEIGLPTGAWLSSFKEQIIRGESDNVPVRIWWRNGSAKIEERFEALGQLRDRIIKIIPGQRIAYVTDAIYSEENCRRIIEVAQDSDILFIEATFLHKDAARAAEKYHLTAVQAGMLARKAGVRRMVLFHFSPKYKGLADLIVAEAAGAFQRQTNL
ncbi:MAG: MBL fold metallo-hydrolase [Smithellaceae bacterium]|nr:MBL fold metallo-hydrolase [Smithellaceae bacterium]